MSLERREFIAALGGAAAWPTLGRAQQRARPLIALIIGWANSSKDYVAAFRKGLGEAGYVPCTFSATTA